MKKIWVVLKREWLQEVRTKWFIVLLVLPFVGISIIWGIGISQSKGLFSGLFKKEKVGVIDEHGVLVDRLVKDSRFIFIPVVKDDALDEKVLRGELAGYLYIDKNVLANGVIEYHAKRISKIEALEDVLNEAVMESRLLASGVNAEELAQIRESVHLKVTKIGAQKEGIGIYIGVGIAMVIILYMAIVFSASMVGRSTVEEKSNRVIEVIIPFIRPFELMSGKLLGIAAVVFTLLITWGVVLFCFTKYIRILPGGLRIPPIYIPSGIILYFLLVFILGYFLFAALILAFVSPTSTEREAHQAQSVPVMLLLIPYFISFFWVIHSPDARFSVVCSLIPFFTPLVMPLRIAIATPPNWQILLSSFLLLATTIIMVWLASKIYRIGILMYGKRPKLSEILRWLKYS